MFHKTVPEPQRETHYTLQERMVSDGIITAVYPLGHAYDGAPDAALSRFGDEVREHPGRYTPHSPRRLVLLAKDGAR